METKENNLRMNQCKMFENCDYPICPLDEFVPERIYLKEDGLCPYCRVFKTDGKKKTIPPELRGLIPKQNIKLLRSRNQTLTLNQNAL